MFKRYQNKAWEFIKKMLLISFFVDLMTKKSRKKIELWLDSVPAEMDAIKCQLVADVKTVRSVSHYVAKNEVNEDFFFKEVLVVEVRFAHFALLQRQDEKPQLLRINGKGVKPWGDILHLAKWGKSRNALQLYFYHQKTITMNDQVLNPI